MQKKIQHCEVCGVCSSDKVVCFRSRYDQVLCNKHYEQLRKRGRIMDVSPFGVKDRNRYQTYGDVTVIEITDNHQNPICETRIDTCYADTILARKWRITYKNGHLYIAAKALQEEKSKQITLHRYVARLAGWDIDGKEIDHINGDTMDNTVGNLRLATRHDQVSNIAPRYSNKYGIRGISFDKRYNKYVVDFKLDNRRLYFKPVKTLSEAVYIRHLAEQYYFDDVAIARHLPDMQPYIDQLSDAQKRDLEAYVHEIIRRKERDAS